ncbi:MAG TPA: Yip1 family protein [Allosphingosinicella sp.]|nr:Yip1 family protein [Allosphingosinicella sp.]
MLEPTPGEPHTLSGGGGGGGGRKGLFERVKAILITPKTEWAVIDGEAASIGGLITGYALILALIAPLACLLGLFLTPLGGYLTGAMGFLIKLLIAVYIISLGTVVLLGFIIDLLASSLGGTKNGVQAMKLAVYAGTPFWLAGILLILGFGMWYFWMALGIGYGGYLIWLGLPILMRVPADKVQVYAAAVIGIWVVLFIILWQIAWRIIFASMLYGAVGYM